ncbi:hypothetical protein K491DRAFT_718245 [Lophiostoma macrostomum CBS 122681]|uniref:Uncharacterized protein n=1 Tax=Lophiostoma macrostomum CBS 122681 TaxID=1314788 RepID=A0A6A6SZQ8_9PLEO|nr:hypothetical protein K491DRAFT_718245 [Lophiostoma macrostomum CBS 122681]
MTYFVAVREKAIILRTTSRDFEEEHRTDEEEEEEMDLNTRPPKDGLAQSISRLVKILIAQLEPLPVTPTILWPLFVLADASPVNEVHRRFVLGHLNGMLDGRNLHRVRLTRRLVEHKFRNCDSGKAVEVEVIGGLRGKRISMA